MMEYGIIFVQRGNLKMGSTHFTKTETTLEVGLLSTPSGKK